MTIDGRPTRLHHYAFPTNDQEATRAFYEDLIGLPLVATWSEADEIGGSDRAASTATRSSRSATAARWRSSSSPIRRIRSNSIRTTCRRRFATSRSTSTADVQDAIERPSHRRAARRPWRGRPRLLPFALHGDPNGLFLEFTVDVDNVDQIARDRSGRRTRHLEAVAGGRPHEQQRLPLRAVEGALATASTADRAVRACPDEEPVSEVPQRDRQRQLPAVGL